MPISVGGLVSGLDTNGMIDQMLALQQQPITKLQQKEAAYQVELTAYGSMESVLGSLKSTLEALETTDDLTDFSAVSGDSDLFTVSADENAAAGAYDITIQQLAEVHKLTSSAFSEEEAVGEGTIHLKMGSGSTTDITVSATDTIDDVAESINAADAGVQAAVIFDGTNYFLSLAAEETGAGNVINLTVTDTGDSNNTDTNGLSRLVYDKAVTENLSNTQDAADAIITVDGVADIHRAKNVIDDAIEGVTITLESAPLAPDNQATLTVSRNTAAVVSKINAFVDAYNKGLDLLESYQGYDSETEAAGILLGDTTTNNIRNLLDNMVSDIVPGVESFSRLTDLGIALNDEGKLELEAETLNSALDDHFDDVLLFFTQSTEGSEGFAVRMLESLDAALDSTDGTLAARTDGIQSSIDGIEDQIERIE
ncbi:MAG: flagellar filament capping protein FliD, partial [bacterium]|nr:flagellar filament capping protein FliD [bacterium]